MKSLKKQAHKIKAAGAKNVPEDSELIHANPSEVNLLHCLGGSGRTDPETGLRHFDAGGNRNDPGSRDTGGSWGGGDDGQDKNSEGYSESWESPDMLRGPGTYSNPTYKGTTTGRNWVEAGLGALTMNPGLLTDGLRNKTRTTNYTANGYGTTPTRNSDYGKAGSGGGDTRSWLTTYSPASGTSASGTASGSSSLFPSVYTDPVTGRLLYQAQNGLPTSNSSVSDQQMLDYLMGTNVASQNIGQSLTALASQRQKIAAAGGDTSWYDSEIQRLNGLKGQSVSSSNPLLSSIDTGAMENSANNTLDNTVANQMALQDNQNARRGMLGSTMQDATRAALGLSTAQQRIANKSEAQQTALKNRMSLASFLKNSQQQDYTQNQGNNAIALELANQENQRAIAEKTAALQQSLSGQNLSYLNGLRSDNNSNAMWNAVGSLAGNIDWSSLF